MSFLRRAEMLAKKVREFQHANDETLYMDWVMPYWAYDGFSKENEGKWFCIADVGKPVGKSDWADLRRLPVQWFDNEEDAKAAAEAIEKQYPPIKRENGKLTDVAHLRLEGE